MMDMFPILRTTIAAMCIMIQAFETCREFIVQTLKGPRGNTRLGLIMQHHQCRLAENSAASRVFVTCGSNARNTHDHSVLPLVQPILGLFASVALFGGWSSEVTRLQRRLVQGLL